MNDNYVYKILIMLVKTLVIKAPNIGKHWGKLILREKNCRRMSQYDDKTDNII